MLEEMGLSAKQAAKILARAKSEQKNQALVQLSIGLIEMVQEILEANKLDIEFGRQKGLSEALLDRSKLTETRVKDIADSLTSIAALPDPVGEKYDTVILDNGLQLHKQRVPLGVLAVIYEARPNVTIDVSGLAIKTGNAVILRGGSESIHTNRKLVEIIRSVLTRTGLPVDAVQFVDNPDRSLVFELLKMHDYIDMLIPRGAASLHQFCRENSLIPVITGGIGICHLFVDSSADLEAAVRVIRNAKIQRPTVCNALDTVLVHQDIAATFIPDLINTLRFDGVTFRVDPSAKVFVPVENYEVVQLAGPDDFDTEWLSLVLGVKVVEGLDVAVTHIEHHSTGHSDGILTHNEQNAQRFIAEVDSSAVYVNASTRFTDGGQFGLGAEVAISTQRLHARGPMGLRELTTYKWVVIGDNHVRP
jgi:glutamate-5-semialdehyde dehydrogenase